MTKDERRRLVYEILVEAKNLKESTDKAKKDVGALAGTFKKLQDEVTGSFKKMAAGFAVAFSVKFIGDALAEVTKFNEQMKALGVAGQDAANGLKAVQEIAFNSGQSVKDVTEVYKAATEAGQQLGLSQKKIVELTDAFTRSAIAEGKTAAIAAQQLDTLQFAYDRGAVKIKEFQQLLKENETFQKASEKALGKTTEELLKMAKAGQIGRVEMEKIIDTMIEMGKQIQVGTTFDRLIEQLKIMGAVFIQTTAEASGFMDALKGGQQAEETLDVIRRMALVVGGVIKIFKNLWDAFYTTARLITKTLADPGNFFDTLDRYQRKSNENLEDFRQAFVMMGGAFEDSVAARNALVGPGLGGLASMAARTSPHYDPGYLAAKAAAEAAAEAAREAAAKEEAAQAKRDAKVRARVERDARLHKEAAETNKTLIEQTNEATDDALDKNKGLLDLYREQARAQNYNEQQTRINQREQDKWIEAHREQLTILAQAADLLGQSIAGIFTGATHTAREFFRSVLQGLAQIFAQQAAMKIATSVFNWGSALMGAAKGKVFDRGLVPFASGGVVTSPTYFGFGGGRAGVMGEAGAEAVMPLRRGPDGRLGVGAPATRVSIINNLGVAANARVDKQTDRLEIVLEAANLGSRIAQREINRSLRTGYGETAQSMQRTYGLARRG
jgi:tape measure domain-containing protein